MSDSVSKASAPADSKPAQILGRADLYALAIGQVIGAGIVSVLGAAIGVTGRSAWLAYFCAIVIGFVTILPFIFVSSVARCRGGTYSLTYGLLGEKWAGCFIMASVPGAFSLSIYGVALGTYVNSLLPAVNPTLVAVLITVVFYIMNMRSVKGIASLQKPMTWLLIGTLLMFMVVGLFQMKSNPFNFGTEDFITNGSDGFIRAIVLLVYSTYSYYMCFNFGGSAKNPKKDIPTVILTVPLVLVVIYCGVGMVASGVLPISEVAGKPLTMVAREILPGPLVILFIVGGVMMALSTSLNSQFGSYGRQFAQGVKDKWFPNFLCRINRHDQPWIIITLAFIITLIPIVTGFNIGEIANNIVLLTYIAGLLPMLGVLRLPKLYPEAWKKSRLHMPDWLFYIIISISIIFKLVVTYWSARGLNVTKVSISLVAIAFCFGYAIIRSRKGLVKMSIGNFDLGDD
jgi:APA family basic amino acid/polyamine antiporter